MRIGCGRVSTRDQHPEAQHDALTAAGCEVIFIDKASGKLASRPELSKALLVANRPKDQLVVTKLDRLGRSLEHRRAAGVAADQGWNPVSYNTVRSIVTALDPAMTTLARDGAAAFRDIFELVYRRRADHPNAMWQVDHTQLDILIDDGGTAKRPWLTVVLDDCSRAVPGYTVNLGAPSALNTSGAAPSDLDQIRSRVADVRYSRDPLCRSRQRLRQ
ncbi:recombinase family protein [Nocardia sp. NPDC050793]|uniref:recombinase family protein n=1 Tax=Nocardia sp. NPDC050793 TaxID=3155159 RepID=UPI0033C068E6